jgi:hypothetical protein
VATLLLNRNREPPDQPRNLVQSRGIVIFDGACEPSEAFVITHCDYIDRNDRRYGPYAIGLDIWHRTTSAESGAVHGPWRMSLLALGWATRRHRRIASGERQIAILV